jgi:hypothetical protein
VIFEHESQTSKSKGLKHTHEVGVGERVVSEGFRCPRDDWSERGSRGGRDLGADSENGQKQGVRKVDHSLES